jgi:GT2 family glycosyltransferase
MSRTHIQISFIILNYNGKEITERCIQSLTENVSIDDYEIIVVDNASSDGSSYYLRNKFPFIRIVNEQKNKFIAAYNDGVREASGDWVFLLNNDMLFNKGFLEFLIPHLNKGDLFAVGSKMVNPAGNTEKCANYPIYKCGYLWINTLQVDDYSPTIYIGCHGLFNREKFLQLGGFDPIYSPFYVEDLDLCYRAWKRGWKVFIEPKSVIIHHHMATIGKFFKKKYVLRIAARNHFIFIWKNITSKKLFAQHILCLPIILLGSLLMYKPYYIKAFFDAFKYRDKIQKLRYFNINNEEMTDENIIQYIANSIKLNRG